MTGLPTRRECLVGLGAAIAGPALAADHGRLETAFARIEAESGGRLGVALLDPATSHRRGHRMGERFPLCSTFKLLACGAILARVDAGHVSLAQRIRFETADVVPYSPVTAAHAGGDGMTLADICEAAITRSDNTAGNLILRTLGGPPAVTAFARSIGDPVTRLDRIETALNEAVPGDPRDTTTPGAMAADMARLLIADTLSPTSRAQLIAWLVANRTGDARLRAGLPSGWRIGDKTGAGDRGTTNDVAILWPPGRKPLILCTYLTGADAPVDTRNATIAAVAHAVAQAAG